MKKLFFVFCLLASPAFALLSPLNQSLKEIKTLLDSSEIQQYLYQGDSIQNIDRDGNNYIIKTKDKQMIVETIYTPPKMPGPMGFKFVFHSPTPKE